ncbi:MAG TPA: hypothetical protein PLP39_08400 [Flavobacterium lutivivi]|jgi:hypothetical protein|nr:hypothetical protein [Flavobacterium lutivivi]
MKKLILFSLLVSFTGFGQIKNKISTYKFGQNGMELVAKTKNETIIISTFNSKMTIRRDIADKLFQLYRENKLETNKEFLVVGEIANVIGKCIIRKKDNLTVVDFYYETVLWDDGLTEVYDGKDSKDLLASDID